MISFLLALVPLYFVWLVIKQVAGAEDDAELLGSLIGIALFIWGLSWLFS